MRNVHRVAAVAVGLLMVLLGVATSPVQAAPVFCSAWTDAAQGYASCNADAGYVRVIVACPEGERYGPWVPRGIPFRSTASCMRSAPLGADYQLG